MQFTRRYAILALSALLFLAIMTSTAAAQYLYGPNPYGVQAGGYTRSYQSSTVGGTFVPTQTQTSEAFYNYPGIGPYGAYPGSGYAYTAGVGPTPYGYTPYGGFTYL